MNGNRSRMDRLHNTVGLACILPITVLFSAFVSLLCPLERCDAHPPGHRQLVSPGRGPGTGKLHYFCRNKCCTKFLQFCKTSSLGSHGSAFILPPGSRRDKLKEKNWKNRILHNTRQMVLSAFCVFYTQKNGQ